jgi:hypothetical protein
MFQGTSAKEIGKVGRCVAAFGGTTPALPFYPGKGDTLRAVSEAIIKSKIRAGGPQPKAQVRGSNAWI